MATGQLTTEGGLPNLHAQRSGRGCGVRYIWLGPPGRHHSRRRLRECRCTVMSGTLGCHQGPAPVGVGFSGGQCGATVLHRGLRGGQVGGGAASQSRMDVFFKLH